jgi:hypothetical protein
MALGHGALFLAACAPVRSRRVSAARQRLVILLMLPWL